MQAHSLGSRGIIFSLILTCFIVAANSTSVQAAEGERWIDLKITDAVYDKSSNLLYAATQSASPQYAQSVVVINPSNLNILASVLLPAVANIVKLSDDGNYLYAAVRAVPSTIYQIDARQMRIEYQYSPEHPDLVGDSKIYDILPVPGPTGRLAISFSDVWGNFEGTALFDGSNRLPHMLDFWDGAATLLPGPAPGVLYGYCSFSTAFTIARVGYSDAGLELLGEPIPGMAWGFHRQLEVHQGLLYASNGTIANVETGTTEGLFLGRDVAKGFAIDEGSGVIYFADYYQNRLRYLAFDIHTFLPIGDILPALDTIEIHKLLITNAGDLVVVGEGSRLLFTPTTALAPYKPVLMPSVEQVSAGLRLLRAPADDLAADPINHRLYFVVSSPIVGLGNSVFSLDPQSGKVSEPTFAGSVPTIPAVSSGGHYLYVSLNGEGAIQRFRLPELIPDAEIKLGLNTSYLASSIGDGSFLKAAQILPLPANEESFAVVQSIGAWAVAEQYDSLAVYDGTVRRTKVLDRALLDPPNCAIAISADNRKIYGLNTESSSGEFSKIALTPDGLTLEETFMNVASMHYEKMRCDGDWCITQSGALFDPLQVKRLGMLPGGGHIIPDRARNRLYVLVRTEEGRNFTEYDAENMTPLRRAALPISGVVINFVRWSENGFAAVTEEGIWLISTDVLAAVSAGSGPIITMNGPHRQVNVAARRMVYDRARQLIYATVPANVTGTTDLDFYVLLGFASGHINANTVIALDPATGQVVKSIVVGSDPGALDISDDGKYLYVGLTTGNAVVRIDLNRWERDRFYRVPGGPNFIKVRPGHPEEYAISFGPGIADEAFGGGGFPYDMGVWLHQSGQPLPTAALPGSSYRIGLFTDTDSLVAAGLTYQTTVTKLRITPSGLAADPLPEYRSLDTTPFALAGNRLFGRMGKIADSYSLRFLEELTEYGAAVPVPDEGRIYYLRRNGVRVYDWNTRRIIGLLPLEYDPFGEDPYYSEMMYCGPKCLAVRNVASITLLNTDYIQWEEPISRQGTRIGDGILRFQIRMSDMKFDSKRNVLYVATPAEEGSLGNSVVPINPSTGQILDPIYVGTFPTKMALNGDKDRLYIGTRGTREIQMVDLRSRRKTATIPVPQINARESYWAEGIDVRPGTQNVLGLTTNDGEAWLNWRAMMIGSDGRMLPSWAPNVFPNYLIGQTVFFSPSGSRLQAIGYDEGMSGMWSLPVISSGVQYEPQKAQYQRGPMAHCSGLIFASNGNVYDGETMEARGSVEVPAFESPDFDNAVACDEAHDRLYYIRTSMQGDAALHSYQLTTRTLLQTRELPSLAGRGAVAKMEALGNRGVAYWTSNNADYNGPYVERDPEDELFIAMDPVSGGTIDLSLAPGGAANFSTSGSEDSFIGGFSSTAVKFGNTPYGTAVFSYKVNGVTVSEAGVPATPPTTHARIFIDYRSDASAIPAHSSAGTIDINTGIAVVNSGTTTANVTYALRDVNGDTITVGAGTIAGTSHFAKFIDQFGDIAAGFALPDDFQTAIQFGSLDISSDQPLSILAVRMTTNQRNDVLYTTTPVADLTHVLSEDPIYFAQFADGGGYTSSLILLNTSAGAESGSLQILDNNGEPITVNPVGSTPASSFDYSIPAGGVFLLRTDGFAANTRVGWVRLTPDAGTSTPVGSGIFGYNPGTVLVSESGAPSAISTTHARIYVDLSGNHNTGLAIANLEDTAAEISIIAYQNDGVTEMGSSGRPLPLAANGHGAKFANELVDGLPDGFIGVLDVRSATPFAALTLRSLYNERNDFLMTTFPVADANRPVPSPIIFPHIVDGAGYTTEFILISAGQEAATTLSFYNDSGEPIEFGY